MTKEHKAGRPCVDPENRKTGAPLFLNLTISDRKTIDAIIQTTGETKTALFRRLIETEARRLAQALAEADRDGRNVPTPPGPTDNAFLDCFDLSELKADLDATFDLSELNQWLDESMTAFNESMQKWESITATETALDAP